MPKHGVEAIDKVRTLLDSCEESLRREVEALRGLGSRLEVETLLAALNRWSEEHARRAEKLTNAERIILEMEAGQEALRSTCYRITHDTRKRMVPLFDEAEERVNSLLALVQSRAAGSLPQ